MYRILRAGTKIPTTNGRVLTLTRDAEVADEWRSDDHFAGSLFNWEPSNLPRHATDLQRFEIDEMFEGKMHHVVYDRSYDGNGIKNLTLLSRTEIPGGLTPDEIMQKAEGDKVKAEAEAIAAAKDAEDAQLRADEAKAKAEDAQAAREDAAAKAEEVTSGVTEPAPAVTGLPDGDARQRALNAIGPRPTDETAEEYEARVEAEIAAQASRVGVLDGTTGEAS